MEPRGFAGGIILLWNSANLVFHAVGGSAQGVHGVVEVRNLNHTFVLSAIYANPRYATRKLLWKELCDMAGSVTHPWLVLGDFNEMINQGEKLGGRPIKKNRAHLYAATMNACNLLDLGFHGQKYTWSNMRRRNPFFERIDRGWVNPEWMASYPKSTLWNLYRVTSNHYPLLVRLDSPIPRLGDKPFRFEPMWLLDNTFRENVEQAWHTVDGDIRVRIKNMQCALTIWNSTIFGNIYIGGKDGL